MPVITTYQLPVHLTFNIALFIKFLSVITSSNSISFNVIL